MYAYQGGCALILEKVPAKGTRCRQDQCRCVFGKLPWDSWQRNKVVGLDGMKAEFILDAGELLHMPLLTTFNCFMEEGFFKTLSTGVVHAFFKGGDASKFDNYKGIIIGLVLAKLFAMILDKRPSEWVEQHGLRAKGQTGFRKDYRITNQLFILRTLKK